MAEFVTGSFNTMDPRLLSPIQAAIRSYGDMQKNALARQQAQQAGIKTQFLPHLLESDIQSKLAPSLISAGQNVFLNKDFENAYKNLMGINSGQALQSQPSQAGASGQGQGAASQADMIRQHILAQQSGLTHPHIASQLSSQAAAIQQLLQMLPGLEKKGQDYGGSLGYAANFLGLPGATEYQSQINTARKLADQAGIDPGFLNSRVLASNVGGSKGSMAKMEPQLQQMLLRKQQAAQAASSGQLLNPQNIQQQEKVSSKKASDPQPPGYVTVNIRGTKYLYNPKTGDRKIA